MIIDNLINFENYTSLHKDFMLIFDYLKTHNLKELECGKYQLRGNDVYFNLQEYQTKDEQKLEAHRKYIDIQIVIDGEENIGYTNIGNTTIKEAYDSEKDVIFLNGEINKLKAHNKNFFIFYPQDAHMPALNIDKPEHVKKAVFKIILK